MEYAACLLYFLHTQEPLEMCVYKESTSDKCHVPCCMYPQKSIAKLLYSMPGKCVEISVLNSQNLREFPKL